MGTDERRVLTLKMVQFSVVVGYFEIDTGDVSLIFMVELNEQMDSFAHSLQSLFYPQEASQFVALLYQKQPHFGAIYCMLLPHFLLQLVQTLHRPLLVVSLLFYCYLQLQELFRLFARTYLFDQLCCLFDPVALQQTSQYAQMDGLQQLWVLLNILSRQLSIQHSLVVALQIVVGFCLFQMALSDLIFYSEVCPHHLHQAEITFAYELLLTVSFSLAYKSCSVSSCRSMSVMLASMKDCIFYYLVDIQNIGMTVDESIPKPWVLQTFFSTNTIFRVISEHREEELLYFQGFFKGEIVMLKQLLRNGLLIGWVPMQQFPSFVKEGLTFATCPQQIFLYRTQNLNHFEKMILIFPDSRNSVWFEEEIVCDHLINCAAQGPDVCVECIATLEQYLWSTILSRLNFLSEVVIFEAGIPQVDNFEVKFVVQVNLDILPFQN